MAAQADKAARFLALHTPGAPLLMPNAWDVGSATLLASLGFAALATTSSGFAATLARLDGAATLDEVLAHSAALAHAVDIPVSADFENGFADDPEGVAQHVALARDTGLAGCSVEDFTRDREAPIYERGLAAERVAAAVAAAHAGPVHFVITARAENHLHGVDDLDDTIIRLQSYQDAGADVLFVPGLADIEDIRRVVSSVDRPVNVLARPGGPTVADLAAAGAARISVGGGFAFTALGAVVDAARDLLDRGTYSWDQGGRGVAAARAAFGP